LKTSTERVISSVNLLRKGKDSALSSIINSKSLIVNHFLTHAAYALKKRVNVLIFSANSSLHIVLSISKAEVCPALDFGGSHSPYA
jgi:hypothetical protein